MPSGERDKEPECDGEIYLVSVVQVKQVVLERGAPLVINVLVYENHLPQVPTLSQFNIFALKVKQNMMAVPGVDGQFVNTMMTVSQGLCSQRQCEST